MHLFLDGLLLLELIDLNLHLNHLFPLAIFSFVYHQFEAVGSFAILLCTFEEVLFDYFLLIKLRLQSSYLFLKKIYSLSLHVFNSVDFLVLLLYLYLISTLNLFLQLLHLLEMLHLQPLVLVSKFLDHGSELLRILIFRPFEFAEFFVGFEALGAEALVVGFGTF